MPPHARRRAVVVLLLGASAAGGAVGYAVLSGPERAAPAAGGHPAGTGTVVDGSGGTVVGGTRPASPSPAPGGAPQGVFSISGRVDGLVPGRRATLPLTIDNPNPWPIRVLSVDVRAEPTGRSDCPEGTLHVDDFEGSVAAPARGRVVVTVPIALADSPTLDQSGCPGVTFPLTFTGTAVRGRG